MLAVISDVSDASESAAKHHIREGHSAGAAELAVLRLLQGAARTPEELLAAAVELLLLGLLKKATFAELCTSLGLGGEALQALLLRTDSASELAALSGIGVGSGNGGNAGGGGGGAEGSGSVTSLVPAQSTLATQKRIAELAAQVSAPSMPPGVGLGSLGLQSRLASEFVLIRKLGQGGMGSVFLARHQLDGGSYAIKIVPFWVGGRRDSNAPAERVLREVQALSRLSHPNVCRYYHAWIETDWASLWRSGHAPESSSSSKSQRPPPAPSATKLALLGMAATAQQPTANGHAHRDNELQKLTRPTLLQPTTASDGQLSSPGGGESSADASLSASFSHSCSGSFGGSFRQSPNRLRQPLNGPNGNVRQASWERSYSGSFSDSFDASFSGGGWSQQKGARAYIGLEADAPAAALFDAASRTTAPLLRQWSYRKALLIQMELCEGRTLRDYLSARDAAKQPVCAAESLELLRQLCGGLGHVHACGLVHRDLKPDNCCFSGNQLKLTDFGLARETMQSDPSSTSADETDIIGADETDAFEADESDVSGGHGGGGKREGGGSHTRDAGGQPAIGDENGAESGGVDGTVHNAKGFGEKAKGKGKMVGGGGGRSVGRGRGGGGGGGGRGGGGGGGAGGLLASPRVGTASYSSPEQLEFGTAVSACDIFPLGLIAFELFHAFGSAMERAKLFAELRKQMSGIGNGQNDICHTIPRDFKKRWPRLAKLVSRMLSLAPAERPSCAEALHAVAELQAAAPSSAPSTAAPSDSLVARPSAVPSHPSSAVSSKSSSPPLSSSPPDSSPAQRRAVQAHDHLLLHTGQDQRTHASSPLLPAQSSPSLQLPNMPQLPPVLQPRSLPSHAASSTNPANSTCSTDTVYPLNNAYNPNTVQHNTFADFAHALNGAGATETGLASTRLDRSAVASNSIVIASTATADARNSNAKMNCTHMSVPVSASCATAKSTANATTTPAIHSSDLCLETAGAVVWTTRDPSEGTPNGSASAWPLGNATVSTTLATTASTPAAAAAAATAIGTAARKVVDFKFASGDATKSRDESPETLVSLRRIVRERDATIERLQAELALLKDELRSEDRQSLAASCAS